MVTTIPGMTFRIDDVAGRVPEGLRWELVQGELHWLDAGTRSVWLVWPHDRRVAVMARDEAAREFTEADTLPGDPVLPGFHCAVQEIFE